MKTQAIIFGAVLSIASLQAGQAKAAVYNPQALTDVETRITQSLCDGKVPVVVFDLDDTLIDTRNRSLRIVHDFGAEAAAQKLSPADALLAEKITESQVRFDLSVTLTNGGIDDADFQQQTQAFWLNHFFTNDFSASDVANPGAVAYVNELYALGAKIVYLTGRDEPRMGDGTRENLKELGFPLGGDNAILMMKPDAQGADLDFKVSQFPALRALGDVVASFENEPMNINAFQAGFPNAVMIFLDTIHSDSPVVPNAGISRVKDFNQ